MTYPHLAALLPLLAPLPALAALLLPSRSANANPARTNHIVRALALASLGFALLSVGALVFSDSPLHHTFLAAGPLGITVYFDVVSAVMLVLVAFLGMAVTLFSRNYLAGDSDHGRFLKWLSVTIGCVLLLVVAGNLALFTLAWMSTSLSLHKLLVFYPERHAAVVAARKKFVFSRIGDVCLLAAIVLAWRSYGTLDYAALFAAARSGDSTSAIPIAFLLVCGAILKSAQFPFHGWLPDTMETPTPVSALMHAGIINAGGYLVIRFSPLVALSSSALGLLAVIGAVTALVGSLVMITQTSVKRTLAFSTVAQMGFMMLQCGLGAFSLALLHIVAHSLYKAHAFLSSGGVIALTVASGAPPVRHFRGGAGASVTFVVSLALVLGICWASGAAPWQKPADFALTLILVIAIAQLLWNWWATASSPIWLSFGVILGAGLCVLFFGLHAGANLLIGSSVANAPYSPVLWPLAILTPLAFLLIALRAFLPPGWAATRLGQSLYIHAYNGFYINTVANRLVHAMWPAGGKS